MTSQKANFSKQRQLSCIVLHCIVRSFGGVGKIGVGGGCVPGPELPPIWNS